MACYQIVNDFKIDLAARKKLGQGSQGSVYPGISLITKDDVAAKRTEGVYKEYFNKEEFEMEADLLLNRIPPHENIIKVYDFTKTEYESKGIPMLDLWLITELCEFGNLKEFAFAHDLSIEQKIEIMYQSALAVSHLHGCKPESIAHRDVKPENILVSGSEDNPIIKLCDFGSAKSVTRKGAKSVTMRSLAGTRRYQAPEQIELHGRQFKYNKQVDIFSLGVTFLALLNAVKGSLMSPETINEKGLGEIMWMKHKQKQEFTFSVHKSSDSALVRAVKYVIENMIKFEPSSRLSAAEVVEKLQTIAKMHLQRQLTPDTDIPSAPARGTPSAPATNTPSTSATDTPSTSATDFPSAPATSTPSAIATDMQSMPPSSEACIPGTKVVALHAFKAVEEGDLSFEKYDVLTIISTNGDSHRCGAKDKSGKRGMIHMNYVRRRREVQLQTMPWYHGKMSWRQANALLTGEYIPETMAAIDVKKLSSNKDVGTFFVHAVSDETGHVATHEYTLCVVRPDKRVGQYHILKQDGKLTIAIECDFFADLPQLVQFYQRNANGLCTNLQKPLVYNGPLRVYAHSRDFLQEGWSVNHLEVDIREKFYTDTIVIHKGSYFGQNVYVWKNIEKTSHNVEDSLIEAAIMTGLSHKNVVQLIGVVLGEKTLIVTEYLAKGQLLEYLRLHGPRGITSQDQINIARDVCQGMRYLEQRNIIHCCIMAISILLSDDGAAKIGDFSLAGRMDGNGRTYMDPTRKYPLKWTEPEAILELYCTAKSDIWGFGVLLWEIYTFGRKPYAGRSGPSILSSLLDGGRLDAPEGCPDQIYDLMLSTWDIDPTKRPTPSDVLQTLDSLDQEEYSTRL